MDRTLPILLVLFGACAEPVRGERPREVIDAADTTVAETIADTTVEDDVIEEAVEVDTAEPPLSFADDGVHDLLVDDCTAAGCHSSGTSSYAITGDVDADDEATLKVVTPGDGLGSKLIKKSTNTSSHQGGPVLQSDTPAYDLIVEWIDDGANP